VTAKARTALVIGSSGGIGRATALKFARSGVQVIAVSRNGDSPGTEFLDGGGSCVAVDLEDAARVGEMACRLLGDLGRGPDILVFAAGAFELAPLTETSVDSFDRQLAVNLRAPFLCLRALLPSMLELEAARVITVGSIAGRMAFPRNGAYAASKFGLRGLHEVLLQETRGTSVGATLIEPGPVDTPLWDPLNPDADPELPARADMLSVDDVADAILFVGSRPAGVRIPYLPVHPG